MDEASDALVQENEEDNGMNIITKPKRAKKGSGPDLVQMKKIAFIFKSLSNKRGNAVLKEGTRTNSPEVLFQGELAEEVLDLTLCCKSQDTYFPGRR